jgi:hypothetical protein
VKVTELHPRLLGEWSGTKRLWMGPGSPELASASRLTIAPVAKGKFITLSYRWAYEGAEQEGLVLVGNQNDDEAASAAWVDSWHMSGKVMACNGTVDDNGAIIVLGSYEAPPGPDWGWRITINEPGPGMLRIVMHNITPEGEAELAVQADYQRVT